MVQSFLDFNLIVKLAFFARERILELVVHAKEAAAHGESFVIHNFLQ